MHTLLSPAEHWKQSPPPQKTQRLLLCTHGEFSIRVQRLQRLQRLFVFYGIEAQCLVTAAGQLEIMLCLSALQHYWMSSQTRKFK